MISSNTTDNTTSSQHENFTQHISRRGLSRAQRYGLIALITCLQVGCYQHQKPQKQLINRRSNRDKINHLRTPDAKNAVKLAKIKTDPLQLSSTSDASKTDDGLNPNEGTTCNEIKCKKIITKEHHNHSTDKPRVIVIGAGASGLFSALTLKQMGVDNVILLEASHRHGGRIYSDKLGDVLIEHGAEELYGPEGGNPIYHDIKKHYGDDAQMPISTWTKDQDVLIVMDQDKGNSGSTCWSETGDCIEDADISNYWTFCENLFDKKQLEAFDRPLSEMIADYPMNIDKAHRAYHLYENYPGAEFGTSIDKLGARSMILEGLDFKLSDEVYGLSSTGYLDALDTLYFKNITEDIFYNSTVTHIDTKGDQAIVTDQSGNKYQSDAVIVSVSLGVLKANTIKFNPELNENKQKAINTIGMGRGMKVSLLFDAQLWPNKMWRVITGGPTGECWTPNKYQPKAKSKVLTCFSMGRNAEKLDALPNDEARVEQILKDLTVALGHNAKKHLITYVMMNWSNDPNIRGSYSNPSVGTVGLNTSTNNMRHHLAASQGKLFFAGEATSTDSGRTVVAAIKSGIRAANEVIQLFKNNAT